MLVMKEIKQNRAKFSVKLCGMDTHRLQGPNREAQRGPGHPQKTSKKKLDLTWVLKDGQTFQGKEQWG